MPFGLAQGRGAAVGATADLGAMTGTAAGATAAVMIGDVTGDGAARIEPVVSALIAAGGVGAAALVLAAGFGGAAADGST